MNRLARLVVLLLAPAFAGGCVQLENMMRTVEVQQPLSAQPAPMPLPPAPNGAIWQQASYVPLFEDQRARRVGDIITVRIEEKLNASKQATTNAKRNGDTAFALADVKFGNTYLLKGGSITGESKNEFEGKGDSGANNYFTGSITVTVIDVLPNGYLRVAGEKQIGINTGSEFVRLSGVVNPTTILANNIVSSTSIGDARLEYRGAGTIDEAQTMGWLSRMFMTVLPF
ncbi:MAG: flagellar basal body L-ring protein FlgH [Burkholderiales bacterium]